MNIVILVIGGFIVLYLGCMIGFFVRGLFLGYSGVMIVTRTDDKLVYSLELHEDPEEFQLRREVIFKVQTSDEDPDRD